MHKTYEQQINEHVSYLRAQGFDVDVNTLEIDTKEIVRCRSIGQVSGRGQLAYKTTTRKLDNGLLGVGTWYRGDGRGARFQTSGLWPNSTDSQKQETNKSYVQALDNKKHADVARRAYGYWVNASTSGVSDYLIDKNVGSYGIRFIDGSYGRVALIPMRDESGKLWNCQFLNQQKPDVENNKVFITAGRVDGLFYCLIPLVNGKPFGIAESYVTAATCYELTGMPTVCAFSSGNLFAVATILRKKYPNSFIFICADNDWHLPTNTGVIKGEEAVAAVGNSTLIVPDFGDIEPGKNRSDWNDLVRETTFSFTQDQIKNKILTANNNNT